MMENEYAMPNQSIPGMGLLAASATTNCNNLCHTTSIDTGAFACGSASSSNAQQRAPCNPALNNANQSISGLCLGTPSGATDSAMPYQLGQTPPNLNYANTVAPMNPLLWAGGGLGTWNAGANQYVHNNMNQLMLPIPPPFVVNINQAVNVSTPYLNHQLLLHGANPVPMAPMVQQVPVQQMAPMCNPPVAQQPRPTPPATVVQTAKNDSPRATRSK